jgi:spermidine/putrescine transport system ATP-binding protein
MTSHPDMRKVAIGIDRVSMLYPGASQPALDAVSLEIRENEFFTLLGPSGCGKTTLLRLIAGFEQPTGGDLTLDGISLVGRMPYERPVNTVFQNYALFPHMTVAQNVGFGLEMQGKARAEIDAAVREMLGLVRLGDYGQRKPSQLSGGQQQRVALARALATRPRVLLLDESLSALDLQLRKEMQIELKRLQRETGITFIFVTHDQEEALTMSDRIAVMRSGKVQQIGSPQDIYEHPANRFVAGFIGEMNLLEGRAAAGSFVLGHTERVPLPDGLIGDGAGWLALRPERLMLVPADAPEAVLQAIVDDVVYQGHDTVYRLRLAHGALLKVRVQNALGAKAGFSRGQPAGVVIPPAAIRLLRD